MKVFKRCTEVFRSVVLRGRGGGDRLFPTVDAVAFSIRTGWLESSPRMPRSVTSGVRAEAQRVNFFLDRLQSSWDELQNVQIQRSLLGKYAF